MVERADLFHIPFYKKEAFTGSDRGIRFWIGKSESAGEEPETVLRAVAWPEPFALKHTADEKKIQKDFEFSEDGLQDIYDWLMGEGREEVLKMQ